MQLFEEWQTDLHGHRAIYRVAGSGPPVVLIHGWPLSGASAFFGEASRNAVLLALEDINGDGGINGQELEVRATQNPTSGATGTIFRTRP